MFIRFLNIACAVFLLPLTGSPQEKIGDATFEYNISVESTGKPVPRGLEGATLTIFLKPLESRSELRSSAGVETTLFSLKSAKGAILKEYSGQRLMITLNRENWSTNSEDYRQLVFKEEEYDSPVAGYKVRKAVSILPDGKSLTVYYAPSIQLMNLEYTYSFPQLDGLPVKFEIAHADTVFIYMLARFNSEPVPLTKFTLPNTGFRLMTYEENQQLEEENSKIREF